MKTTNFNAGIFISYCHQDNEHKEIDLFNDKLYLEIKKTTKLNISLFQDTNSLRIGDEFDEVIQNAIKNSIIFVAILSPSYFKSEYCMRELRMYLDLLQSKNFKGHIFPIFFVELVNLENYNKKSRELYNEVLKFQFCDWRKISKTEPYSDSYKLAFEKIVNNIRDKIIETSLLKTTASSNSLLLFWLREVKKILPAEEPPKILICGKTGNGKSTTINTLFQKRVAETKGDEVGTTRAERYNWSYQDENICLIDLPGLGVSKEEDKKYVKHYIPWLTKKNKKFLIHAILIVLAYPRLDAGTWDTLQLILKRGFSPKSIIFGFNKLTELTYRLNKDDIYDTHVKLDMEYGLDECDKQVVEQSKQNFLDKLNMNFPGNDFTLSQCIEYDSRGWNIETLISALVSVMPYTTLRNFMVATQRGRRERIERSNSEEKKIELVKVNNDLTDRVAELITEGVSKTIHCLSTRLGNKFDAIKPQVKNFIRDAIHWGKKRLFW